MEISTSNNTKKIKSNLNTGKNSNINNQALVKNFPYKKQIPVNKKEITTHYNKHNENAALQEINLLNTENQLQKNENLINLNNNKIPLKNTNYNIENLKEEHPIPSIITSIKNNKENKNQPTFIDKNKKKNIKK